MTSCLGGSPARCTSITPEPPMPHIIGSITPCTSAVVTAASTALPPPRSTSRPASAATGCGHTIIALIASPPPAPPAQWGQAPLPEPPSCPGRSGRLRRIPPGLRTVSAKWGGRTHTHGKARCLRPLADPPRSRSSRQLLQRLVHPDEPGAQLEQAVDQPLQHEKAV